MHLTRKVGLALALLTVGSLVSARPATAQHVYDASADFSTTTNPSPLDGGVFSYGGEATLGGPFSLDTQLLASTGNVSGVLLGWSGPAGFPLVGMDISSTAWIYDRGGTVVTIAPNQLDLHPASDGTYSVLRFTAPTTSTFSFLGNFNGADSRPTTTDVHVLLNGISIADGGINVNGGGNTANLSSNSLALKKGDTLDFVVGYGNGNYFYDSTGLFAKVTDLNAPVPEASTTVSFGLLLCLGLGGMVVSARRRKARSAE